MCLRIPRLLGRAAKMPLLGRHKATSGGSSSSPSQQPAAQVCQSPLFGQRRQLNLSPLQRSNAQAQHKVTTPSRMGATSANQNFNQNQQQNQQELPQHISQQQIHYAFALMDTNGDGMIDLHDLSRMLANLGVPIDESILSYIITSVSRRGDHKISESEFLDWIGQFIEVTSGNDDKLATEAIVKRQLSGERRTRSMRPKFRLAGGSSGTNLVANPDTETSEQIGVLAKPGFGRRGSVGSGLALMRSLSGPNLSSKQEQTPKANNPKELVAATAGSSGYSKSSSSEQEEIRSDLKAAFCVFDLDGDGFITFDEVRAGLKLLGESWSPSELRKLFSAAILAASSGSGSASSSYNSTNSDLSNEKIDIDDFVKLLL